MDLIFMLQGQLDQLVRILLTVFMKLARIWHDVVHFSDVVYAVGMTTPQYREIYSRDKARADVIGYFPRPLTFSQMPTSITVYRS